MRIHKNLSTGQQCTKDLSSLEISFIWVDWNWDRNIIIRLDQGRSAKLIMKTGKDVLAIYKWSRWHSIYNMLAAHVKSIRFNLERLEKKPNLLFCWNLYHKDRAYCYLIQLVHYDQPQLLAAPQADYQSILQSYQLNPLGLLYCASSLWRVEFWVGPVA